MTTLPHVIRLYYPSQSVVDSATLTNWKLRTVRLLSRLFGGATTYQAVGYWRGQAGLVVENVTVIEAFSTVTDYRISRETVEKWAESLRGLLVQEAIAVQFDGITTIVEREIK